MNIGLILSILIPVLLVLSIFLQPKIDTKTHTMVNLDFFRFVFSVLIIILHGEFLVYINKDLHFVINDVIVRVAVPFFLIVSGYLVSIKSKNDSMYESRYIRNLVKNYSFWFLVYIPVLILSVFEYKDLILDVVGTLSLNTLSIVVLIPVVIVVAYFYMGSYYHLWYYPATFLSLGILKYWNKRKWNVRVLLGISFGLFLFGLTESYYGLLPGVLQGIVSSYMSIFYTTRNFLFFGLFFVVLGYVVGRIDLTKIKYSVYKLAFFVVLLVLESYLINDIERFNLNFLLMTVPVSFYLVVSLLRLPSIMSVRLGRKLRGVSKYVYLIHPAVILLFVLLGVKEYNVTLYGVLIVSVSLILSYIMAEKK